MKANRTTSVAAGGGGSGGGGLSTWLASWLLYSSTLRMFLWLCVYVVVLENVFEY